MQRCADQAANWQQYSIQEGLLFHKHRLVIPSQAAHLKSQIMQEFHASPIGGHSGFLRTYVRIASQFCWHGMKLDIKRFMQECLICQQAKTSHLHLAGLLNPLPIPHQVWEEVAMDFITHLPSSFGYSVIMVVIDRLSKYAHFAPLKANYTSQQVAEQFFHTVVKLHGLPQSIVSDRDKVFSSSFWNHLFKLQGTTLKMSSSYHPRTDG